MKISVVIPVYKKKKLFLGNLKKNYPYLKNFEIIVVDDASKQDIPEELNKTYPSIMVLENMSNRGFAPTVNRGFDQAKGDIVVLLNTDVILTDRIDKKIQLMFKNDKNLFAVSFGQFEGKKDVITGKNVIKFEKGMVVHSRAENISEGITGWAEGGSCAISKEYFEELDGFREIYAPFYWEDIDLSYRAHKAGYNVLFTPEILVHHEHESTIGSFFSKARIKAIAYRNQFLFTWTNLDKKQALNHFFKLPVYLVRAIIGLDIGFLRGLIAALIRMPEVLFARMENKKTWSVKDVDIFDKLRRS